MRCDDDYVMISHVIRTPCKRLFAAHRNASQQICNLTPNKEAPQGRGVMAKTPHHANGHLLTITISTRSGVIQASAAAGFMPYSVFSTQHLRLI